MQRLVDQQAQDLEYSFHSMDQMSTLADHRMPSVTFKTMQPFSTLQPIGLGDQRSSLYDCILEMLRPICMASSLAYPFLKLFVKLWMG